jgi:hypothetical protein
MDLYRYVLNDPTVSVDIYGLINWGMVGKGIAELIGGGFGVVGGLGAIAGGGPVGWAVGLASGVWGVTSLSAGLITLSAGLADSSLPPPPSTPFGVVSYLNDASPEKTAEWEGLGAVTGVLIGGTGALNDLDEIMTPYASVDIWMTINSFYDILYPCP